jgi:alpha,alpha-trehalase
VAGGGRRGGRSDSALARFDEIAARLASRSPAVFLDYDGTLTPIVARPERARLSRTMRARVARLARRCPVAIVSGRARPEVARLVGLDTVYYVGSHGFDISGPGGVAWRHPVRRHLGLLRRARRALAQGLDEIPGVRVEDKTYAVAVHYRVVAAASWPTVRRVVRRVARQYPALAVIGGKRVLELRPRLDWHKGRAVLWLLDLLGLSGPEALPVYVGDDATDADAFRLLRRRGVGVLVARRGHLGTARYRLRDPAAVGRFLDRLSRALGPRSARPTPGPRARRRPPTGRRGGRPRASAPTGPGARRRPA